MMNKFSRLSFSVSMASIALLESDFEDLRLALREFISILVLRGSLVGPATPS